MEDFLGIMFIMGVIAFLIFVVRIDDKMNAKCEAEGGIIVHSYGANNCWKDGQFINIEI